MGGDEILAAIWLWCGKLWYGKLWCGKRPNHQILLTVANYTYCRKNDRKAARV
jgi:hypothetical protein